MPETTPSSPTLEVNPSFAEAFANPPAAYRPMPFFVWNGEVTEGRIDALMEQYAANGCGGVFIHPRPGLITDYLSERWFELWGHALKRAEELGMECHIYDENSFPAGFAGGHVPARDPLCIGFGLVTRVLAEPMAGHSWSKVEAAFRQNPEGGWEVCPKEEIKEASPQNPILTLELERCPVDLWKAGFGYVDLADPWVARRFLEVTYEPYRVHFGGSFGKAVKYGFADEPHLAKHGLPWSPAISVEFRREHGYALESRWGAFIGGDGEKAVRLAYWKTLNRLFTQNYVKAMDEGCREMGLAFTGHFLDSNWPNPRAVPNLMAGLREMEVPGTDLLGFQFYPTSRAKLAKYVVLHREIASVCNQLGRARSLSESTGGGGYEMAPTDFKPLEDFLLAYGINVINPHLSHQTLSGARKWDWPQTLSDHSPWWEDYGPQAEHTGRVAWALSEGREVNRILVLQPTTTGWMYFEPLGGDGEKYDAMAESQGELVTKLSAAQVDFDLGDEIIMEELGRVENGKLMVGEARYEMVIIPEEMENLQAATLKLLREGLEAGLTVLAEALPTHLEGVPSAEPTTALSSAQMATTHDELLAELLERFPPVVGLDADEASVEPPVHRLVEKADGSRVLFVAQCWEATWTGILRFPAERVAYLDTSTGEVSRLELDTVDGVVSLRVKLPPRSHLLLHLDAESESGPSVTLSELDLTKPFEAPAEEEWQAAGDLSWSLERAEENVLMLDYVDYTHALEQHESMPSIKADSLNWKLQGFEKNVWRVSIQFRQVFLERGGDEHSGFKVRYRFEADPAMVGQDLAIGIERAWLYAVDFNGAPVDVAKAPTWFDEHMRLLPLKDVRAGENVVTLKAERFDTLMEIQSAFLVGDFALEAVERGFLVKPSEPLTWGDWTQQGCPFYANGLVAKTTLELKEPSRWLKIEAGAWRGSALRVEVDGEVAGRQLHPGRPLLVEYPLCAGSHEVKVILKGNLKNQMGPHFNDGLPGGWTWEFCPDDLPAGEAYRFYPTGLPQAPVICVAN